jgi:hypothetical protein
MVRFPMATTRSKGSLAAKVGARHLLGIVSITLLRRAASSKRSAASVGLRAESRAAG